MATRPWKTELRGDRCIACGICDAKKQAALPRWSTGVPCCAHSTAYRVNYDTNTRVFGIIGPRVASELMACQSTTS